MARATAVGISATEEVHRTMFFCPVPTEGTPIYEEGERSWVVPPVLVLDALRTSSPNQATIGVVPAFWNEEDETCR